MPNNTYKTDEEPVMSIITISRGTFSGAQELAKDLSQKLNYRSISREELAQEVIDMGIPEEKLKEAVRKPPRARQPLGNLRDIYIAAMRYRLCEHMLAENVVYCGHTGHLLLPGIRHIMRIRVMADIEHRIRLAEKSLNLDRALTKDHIEEIDADRNAWVQFLYGINWHDPIHYDLIVNLTELTNKNAVDIISSMAGWQEFQFTPTTVKAIESMRLASYARVLLGLDKRTKDADVRITADDGYINATYTPQQAQYAPFVRDVLSGLEGCKEVNTTIADTNILWIQEKFDIKSDTLQNVLEVAKKWDAAVELLKHDSSADSSAASAVNGETGLDPGTNEVSEALKQAGHSGGCFTVYGDIEHLCSSIQNPQEYSLMIIDKLFLSKGRAAQKRLTNEARGALSDAFNVPVIEPSELVQRAQFSFKDKMLLIGRILIAAAIFIPVFLNQESVLRFVAGEEFQHLRIVSLILIVTIVPFFAYLYATTVKTILKMFRID